MTYQCVLSGAGFAITFTMQHISKDYLDVVVAFAIEPSVQPVIIRSVPNYITVDEVTRLLIYFEDHLIHIEEDSPIFMPLEVGFQLQAQEGYRDSDETGYIGLLVLANIGFQLGSDSARIYSGGKVIVTFAELNSFLEQLRTMLIAVQAAQVTMPDPEQFDE